MTMAIPVFRLLEDLVRWDDPMYYRAVINSDVFKPGDVISLQDNSHVELEFHSGVTEERKHISGYTAYEYKVSLNSDSFLYPKHSAFICTKPNVHALASYRWLYEDNA